MKEKSDMKKLQVLQNTVVRGLTGLPNITSQKDLQKRSKWMNVEQLRNYSMVMNMFKARHYFTSRTVANMIIRWDSGYSIRSNLMRLTWKPKLRRKGERAFMIEALKVYNWSGVENMRHLSHGALKSRLKKKLFEPP